MRCCGNRFYEPVPQPEGPEPPPEGSAVQLWWRGDAVAIGQNLVTLAVVPAAAVIEARFVFDHEKRFRGRGRGLFAWVEGILVPVEYVEGEELAFRGGWFEGPGGPVTAADRVEIFAEGTRPRVVVERPTRFEPGPIARIRPLV